MSMGGMCGAGRRREERRVGRTEKGPTRAEQGCVGKDDERTVDLSFKTKKN